MSEFLSKLITEEIDSKYCRIMSPFLYYSSILKQKVVVPVGFVCDYESVPLIKATSKRGGVMHDYLCRKDSKPVVTKKVAADVYLEAMTTRKNAWWRRYIKYWVVRGAWGYFHQLPVMASYEEVAGIAMGRKKG